MGFSWTTGRLSIIAPILCAIAAGGCTWGRMPRIDPTGRYVFTDAPLRPMPAPCPSATPPPCQPQTSRPGLTVRKSGPATVALGCGVPYRIEISNTGDTPVREVAASDEIPDGLTYVSSTPPAEVAGKRIQWRLGDLQPRQRQMLQLNFRATQQGSVANCVEVTAAGGLRVSDCASTTVVASTIDVRMTGPGQVPVGGNARFEIVITNRSQVPAAGLVIWDRLDEGLEHPEASAKRTIDRQLGTLAPGQSQQVAVTFRVTRPGRLCHIVEIRAGGAVLGSSEGCVTGLDSGGGGAAEIPAKPAVSQGISVKVTGPADRMVGETAVFNIDVVNTGTQPLTDVRVVNQPDLDLTPVGATPGNQRQGNALTWTIPNLAPGQTFPLTVHCQCMAGGARVCNRVTAQSREGPQDAAEACLVVRGAAKPIGPPPPAAKLTVVLLAQRNDIRAGKLALYTIRVTNDGPAAQHGVKVTAALQTGLTVDLLGTEGPPGITRDIQNGMLRFSPVPELRPGETLEYRISAQTRQPGQYRVHVEASSEEQFRPVVEEKTTDVIAAGP